MFCNHSDKYRKDDSADSEFEEPVCYDKILKYITSLNDFVQHWCYINNLPHDSEEEILAHKILTIDNSKEVKLFCVLQYRRDYLQRNYCPLWRRFYSEDYSQDYQ